MKKRLAIAGLALCLVLAAGCNNDNEESGSQPEEPQEEISQEEKERYIPEGDAYEQFEKGILDLGYKYEEFEIDPATVGAERAKGYQINDGGVFHLYQFSEDAPNYKRMHDDWEIETTDGQVLMVNEFEKWALYMEEESDILFPLTIVLENIEELEE